MKTVFLGLGLIIASNARASCPPYVELSDLWESDEMVQMGSSEWTGLTPLFAKYENEIRATFLEKECTESIKQTSFRSIQDGLQYRVVITGKDYCDGGNSYGYILNEDDSRVIAFIRDSYIICR